MKRVYLIANHRKPQVIEALKHFRPWLDQRAQIICDVDSYAVDSTSDFQSPADLAIVLGGDGTLLSIGRIMVDLNTPILGVNFGKLGFLAPFNLDEMQAAWDNLITKPLPPTSERVLLNATIQTTIDNQPETHTFVAVNDCVITAGRPFRMIDLELRINAHKPQSVGTPFSGDGVLISTPSGSTAYNVSAGGPILAPDVNAMVVTPICPHSLSFRPLVVHGNDTITIQLLDANEGTTLVIDGQLSQKIGPGTILTVKRHTNTLKLISNPDMDYWKTLVEKMHWASRVRNSN